MEDCGGVGGYYRFLEFAQTGVDPWGEDAGELKEWCGGWDPEVFDIEEARMRLSLAWWPCVISGP